MAHAKPWVSSCFCVRCWASPVLNQKIPKRDFPRLEILWIHGTQKIVTLNALIKALNEAFEEGRTADSFVESFFHVSNLSPR